MVNTAKNFLIMLKNLQQGHLKCIQKESGATNNLIGNKIPNRSTRVSKISLQNDSETNEEKMLREKYIP